MQITLHPAPTGMDSLNPFKDLEEFPWNAQFQSIKHGSNRRLLAIELDGKLVGGMTVDYTCRPPQLIFFEIIKRYRGRGIGKAALLTLIDELILRRETQLFIQTGRQAIYRRMGFHFTAIQRSGLVIELCRPLAECHVSPGTPMVLIQDEAYLWHDTYGNPESPHRVSQTLEYLQHSGTLEKLAVVAPRYAEIDEIAEVHDRKYIDYIQDICEREESIGSDTQTCRATFDIARLAFGGALLAGEYIEDWRRIFVLGRPPGHHATFTKAMGFCFFNNIAGLALYLYKCGYSPMIIDWDAHHGNGTQELLYTYPIPFISFHQRDLFPWTGYPNERGQGDGLGYNYNIMLPPLCTDQQFLTAFQRVNELADQYRPDVILVSAGQDGHHADILSGMLLTTECYRQMAETVRRLADRYADGRIILLLEGGYNLDYLGQLNSVIIQEIAGLQLKNHHAGLTTSVSRP